MDNSAEMNPRLAKWSWALLWLTIGVIVGGSLVRATGSGDGCGDTWPRCQGSLFPLDGGTETTIEFAHRAATALLGLVLVWLVAVAWRRTPREPGTSRFAAPWKAVAAWRAPTSGRELRRAINLVVFFFLGEVLIGAILVLAGWVDTDASIGRVVVVPLHLVNTFFLVAATALVVHIANGGRWPRYDGSRRSNRYGLVILGVLLVVATTGALNALADTLFPPDSLLEGIRDEFGPAAPFLVRLRVLHPVVAISGGIFVAMMLRSAGFDGAGRVRHLANAAAAVIGLEAVVGLANVALLTPVEIQLIHLLIADVLWVLAVFAVMRVFASSTEISHQLEPA